MIYLGKILKGGREGKNFVPATQGYDRHDEAETSHTWYDIPLVAAAPPVQGTIYTEYPWYWYDMLLL